MLGVHFDPHKLWSSEDRDYMVWLATVIERVHDSYEKARK